MGRLANGVFWSGFTFAGRRHTLDRKDDSFTLHGGTRDFVERHWQLERDGTRARALGQAAPDGLDLSYVLDDGRAKVAAPSGLYLEPQSYVDACNQGFPLSMA